MKETADESNVADKEYKEEEHFVRRGRRSNINHTREFNNETET